MKRGLIVLCAVGALAVATASAQGYDYYRQSPYGHAQRGYSCGVPAYTPRYYPQRTVTRRSHVPHRSFYGYGQAPRIYQSPYYSGRSHLGVHSRGFSLHLGY